jgi:hypothetical protein
VAETKPIITANVLIKKKVDNVLTSEAGKTGNPLSDAETHVNLVNELNKQVQ